MEDLNTEYIEDKAKRFRINIFKPIGFFSKLFNRCYIEDDIDKLLSNAINIKELAESKIIELKDELKFSQDLVTEYKAAVQELNTELYDLTLEKTNLEKDLEKIKTKHSKEIEKLAKTIKDLQYSKCCLEKEVVGLRTDLNECNKKFDDKTKNNNKQSGQFMDKLLKTNEKLSNELKNIKEFLKKKKIKIEL